MVVNSVHDIVIQDEVLKQNLKRSDISNLCCDVERFADSLISFVINCLKRLRSPSQSLLGLAIDYFETGRELGFEEEQEFVFGSYDELVVARCSE